MAQLIARALLSTTDGEGNLLETWLYIAEDQPINADCYLDKLKEKAQKMAEFPDLGRERPELAEGLKSFLVDAYSLYYTVNESKLVLVRVLPGGRNLPAIF